MNRVLTAALALFLMAIPLHAQMRVARPMGSGRMSAGPRVGFGTHVGVRGPVVRGGFGVRSGFGGRHVFVGPGFRGPFYPRVRRFPYANFGYYSPYLYSSYAFAGDYGAVYPSYVGGYSYDDRSEEQRTAAQYQQLNSQLNDLTAEVRDLRDENAGLRAEMQGQKSTSRPKQQKDITPPAPAAQKATEQDPATVIVYKDGHQREVRSFAIVGKTLWILSEQRAQKVPFAELDMEATEKANAERGIEFPMPVTK